MELGPREDADLVPVQAPNAGGGLGEGPTARGSLPGEVVLAPRAVGAGVERDRVVAAEVTAVAALPKAPADEPADRVRHRVDAALPGEPKAEPLREPPLRADHPAAAPAVTDQGRGH